MARWTYQPTEPAFSKFYRSRLWKETFPWIKCFGRRSLQTDKVYPSVMWVYVCVKSLAALATQLYILGGTVMHTALTTVLYGFTCKF